VTLLFHILVFHILRWSLDFLILSSTLDHHCLTLNHWKVSLTLQQKLGCENGERETHWVKWQSPESSLLWSIKRRKIANHCSYCVFGLRSDILHFFYCLLRLLLPLIPSMDSVWLFLNWLLLPSCDASDQFKFSYSSCFSTLVNLCLQNNMHSSFPYLFSDATKNLASFSPW
jgi:hypothetical protein